MIDVVMPQMGESIVEGTLTKWLKKAGDRVERDEALFEISTDKVDTEIPSPSAGVLSEVLVEEGKTVAVNTVVARIDEKGEAKAAPPPPQPVAAAPPPSPVPQPPPPVPQAAPAAASEEDLGPLSPLVRKMAREYNLDLRKIKGTGARGRITKQDVEAHLAAEAAPPVPPPPAVEPPPPARAEAPRARVEPMTIMRSRIAEHMVMSKRTSAHVTTVHRIDMSKAARVRERNKEEVKNRYGYSLTFLPFITRAAAEALRAFPIVNASIEGTNIIYHNEINIGIAVALEGGLIVPVIRRADEMSVLGLQRAIVDLAARARSRQLKPDEVHGGTFSITNFGSNGSLFGTPVINQPQVAILGVGVVEKAPVVIDDAIAIRHVSLMGLTFDHRLIDGALADQFMQKMKSVLENWSEQVL
ncbi:MAG TPA: dihydrolipoamide acetyltransferase family protein [Bryobacteraceae bacterium]|nr:dihydrolipoamide acetyltransferase family protein [Bryobacteraceae bacterium]